MILLRADFTDNHNIYKKVWDSRGWSNDFSNQTALLNVFLVSFTFSPIVYPRYNKTPWIIVKHLWKTQVSLENSSFIRPYIFLCKMRVSDLTIHLLTLCLPQVLMSTTCQACAMCSGDRSANKTDRVSGPRKPAASEGRPTLSPTTTKIYFNCDKYYKEAVEGDTEAFSKQT